MNTSGPNLARLFGKLLALVFLDAWISLGVQVRVLLCARGLLPAQHLVEEIHQARIGFLDAPTLFYWGAPDWALIAGIWLGVALALAALLGLAPRVLFALSTLLYLSYATIGQTFLSFQWDNLLLECGAFAVLLPTSRPAPAIHLLFRLILFKLYWESGLAKWQSSLRDWQDGSAMTYYYETAPLPAAMAWYAHHAPVWWHHFESWATLFLELVLPIAIFAPRRVRLIVAAAFTLFQLFNAATANYGFFCYLACALHVFLLDDSDVARFFRRPSLAPSRAAKLGGWAALAGFVSISLFEAAGNFARVDLGPPRVWAPFRVINTYHLFASITRERIEPEFQTRVGGDWNAHELHYKPGSLQRRPPYVAPHQPRVDFQLWFHGLAFRRGVSEYLANLLDRLCTDPRAVQPLFTDRLSDAPDAVRIVYWQYHFTTASEREIDGNWWRREKVGETRELPCASYPP